MQERIVFALIGICGILMLFLFITDSLSEKRKRILFSMVFASTVLLVSEQLARSYNGVNNSTGIIIARTAKFLNYEINLMIIYIFAQYLKDFIGKTPKSIKVTERILYLGMIMVIISQFTGFYYAYDANNIYQRSRFYFVSYVFSSVTIVIIAVNIVKHRKAMSKNLFAPFLMSTLAPLVASIVHLIMRGIPLISATIVAMTVLLYCFSIFDANEVVKTAHKREIENIELMISQTVSALAEAIDAKDAYTNGHSRRVAEYSAKIAEKYGKTKKECEEIYLIGLLHDVGKIGIPDSIINKTGRLTDEEYAIIKTHPTKGKEILSKISISPKLVIGANYHHERYDGKGYPEGLKGEEIPEIARIIAVADSYDAMASKRSYRDSLPKTKIRDELVKGMGSQFDSKFASIMVNLLDENQI